MGEKITQAFEKVKEVNGKSWRTNLSAQITAVCLVLGAIKMGMDGDLTKIDFTKILEAVMFLAVSFGLMSARDDKVSSEDAGAK